MKVININSMISGFRPVRSKLSPTLPPPQEIVIANSQTLTVGDIVKIVAGGLEPADAVNDRIYGVVVGFVDNKGLSYDLATGGFDGTYTQAVTGDTYAAAADNQTVKKVKALIIPSEGTIFSAKLNATKGTTTGSDTVGYYVSVLTTDSTQLNESTATATSEQFLIVGFDPVDASRPLVEVVEYQIFN